MSYIRKIESRLKGIVTGAGRQSTGVKDLPVDHQLSFNDRPGERWAYKEGHVYVNDVDVEELVDYEEKNIRLWCALSEALSEYKTDIDERGGADDRFFMRIGAVQDKVACNLKKLYDEKMDGFYLTYGDGELLFNNFNVRAFLAMYHLRPTTKARKFLIGMKAKLMLILVNRNGIQQHERVHRVVQKLYDEVIDALEVPPMERACLPAGREHVSM